MQRVAHGCFERERSVFVEQASMQRHQWLRASMAWVDRVHAWCDDRSFEYGARFVQQRRFEQHDLKCETSFACALDGDFPWDLDADAAGCARPLRAAARPVRAPREVHRRAVVVGDGAQQRAVSCEASDRHARKRTPQDDRTGSSALERSGHERSVRAAQMVAMRDVKVAESFLPISSKASRGPSPTFHTQPRREPCVFSLRVLQGPLDPSSSPT